jgi:hypothetical protein
LSEPATKDDFAKLAKDLGLATKRDVQDAINELRLALIDREVLLHSK